MLKKLQRLTEYLRCSRFRWIHQLLKFGIVGMLATGVHVGVYVALVEWAALYPVIANVLAFGVAVLVTFFGHYYWTFVEERKNNQVKWHQSLLKLYVTALIGLALNSLIVLVIVETLHLPYYFSIPFMVTLVPVVTFSLNKYWAFIAPVNEGGTP